MLQVLPFLPAEPRFSYTVTLDGVQFFLTYTYRERLGSWYLDADTVDGAPLVRGRRCSPGFPLIDAGIVGRPAGFLTVDGPDPYARDEIRILYYPLASITPSGS